MIEELKKITYNDIKPEINEIFLSVEKSLCLIWFPISALFIDHVRDNTNYFFRINEFWLDTFGYENTIFQIWLIGFFLAFCLVFFIMIIVEGIITIIYRIKPNWW